MKGIFLRIYIVVFLIGLTVSFTHIAYSQAGELDLAFGKNGSVTTNFQSLPRQTEYRSISIQSNGKIVAAGFAKKGFQNILALARYNSNGSLDKTFSNDGKVTATLLPLWQVQYKKMVRYLWQDLPFAKYNVHGSLDNTFPLEKEILEGVSFSSIAIQNDGKIVVAGTTGDPEKNNQDFIVFRYNNNGSLDKTFSEDGKMQTNIFFNDITKSLKVQDDGKIVVSGTSEFTDHTLKYGEYEWYFTVIRYTNDGNLDSSFNGSGILRYFIQVGTLTSVVLQDDGKIVVSGASGVDRPAVILLRFNTDGTFDNSFGNKGLVVTPLSGRINPATIQADGKIVVGGHTTSYNFAVARYNVDGNIDSSFGEGGLQSTRISSDYDALHSLATLKNEIYAAGVGDQLQVL